MVTITIPYHGSRDQSLQRAQIQVQFDGNNAPLSLQRSKCFLWIRSARVSGICADAHKKKYWYACDTRNHKRLGCSFVGLLFMKSLKKLYARRTYHSQLALGTDSTPSRATPSKYMYRLPHSKNRTDDTFRVPHQPEPTRPESGLMRCGVAFLFIPRALSGRLAWVLGVHRLHESTFHVSTRGRRAKQKFRGIKRVSTSARKILILPFKCRLRHHKAKRECVM